MKKVFGLSFMVVFILAACAPAAVSSEPIVSQNGIEVSDPWVRAAAMKEDMGEGMQDDNQGDMHGGAVTGAFMLIKNTGSQDDMLISASSDVAMDVQIHETTMADGVMSMAEVPGVKIPADGVTELKPGGYHVMLIGLKQELKVGDTVTIVLTFQNAGDISLEVPVKMP